MNKSTGLALLGVGIVLLVLGFKAADSISSELSELFSGTPSNKAVWLLTGGALCTGLGLFSVVKGQGK